MISRRRIAQLPPLGDEARDDASYRAQDRAWSVLVSLFDHYNRTENLSYEALGRRIKRSRSQIQRWLSSSFNMNMGSFGLLAEGLDADVIIDVRPRSQADRETRHPREAARVRLETAATTSSVSDSSRVVVSQGPETLTYGKHTWVDLGLQQVDR